MGALNFITTTLDLRAKGMTMMRMPLTVWAWFITAILGLLAFGVLLSAGILLLMDRNLGTSFFVPLVTVNGQLTGHKGGSPLLWQHLFWFFGHPEVYILILPFFGVITEIVPVFSRKPIFGYAGLILATLTIAGLSVGVWAHHMFATGAVLLPFFSGMSFLIAVPTGVKFFNWIGTMWGGHLNLKQPLIWSLGFMVSFLIGGLTGPMLASAPLDFHFND